MTYKLQVYAMPSAGNLIDLPSPGPGWHIEKIMPIKCGEFESNSPMNSSVWSSAEGRSVDVVCHNKSSTPSYQVMILWKHYEPRNQELNDAVTKDLKECNTW